MVKQITGKKKRVAPKGGLKNGAQSVIRGLNAVMRDHPLRIIATDEFGKRAVGANQGSVVGIDASKQEPDEEREKSVSKPSVITGGRLVRQALMRRGTITKAVMTLDEFPRKDTRVQDRNTLRGGGGGQSGYKIVVEGSGSNRR